MVAVESISKFISFHDKKQIASVHFENLGFNEQWEKNRRDVLVKKFGHNGLLISQHEHNRLVAYYKKEFIDDSPFSPVNVYWFDGVSMYTFPKTDPLFAMNIDKRERDGLTLQGWENMQKVVLRSFTELKKNNYKDEVVIWYSPSGPAGTQPPFNNIFESGRMYISIVRPDGFVFNFDCKFHEQSFNVLTLLNQLNNNHQSNNRLIDYLTNPFSTGMTSEEFFSYITSLPNADKIAHTSRIHSKQPVPNSLSSIIDGIKTELNSQHTQNEINFMQQMLRKLNTYDPIGDKSMTAMEKTWNVFTWDPAQDYLRVLHHAAFQNGGSITLYGCAGKTFVDDPLGLNNTDAIMPTSIFDTQNRIANGSPIKNDKKSEDICCPNCGFKIDVCTVQTCGGCGMSRNEMYKKYQEANRTHFSVN